jgi:hypothetical protein
MPFRMGILAILMFLAHMKDKTVIHFRTGMPEDAISVSTGDSDIIGFRNVTVRYTFRDC